jgi:hypothetical protein
VFLAATGIAAIAAPTQAFADARPTAVVSVVAAERPAASILPAAAASSAARPAPAVAAAAAQNADDASSPTVGETIKRIKLWQSLTSMGILVGALVLVRRVAVRR